ncbi:T9SS C-terminal target domain-containing protein [Flavobacterium nackdongense]|uniref:T9SS C-terminal target domain-containing protein n=1 Tax=Flavobacterium nackdongense TaxID=2547394 RepID=A0A4P6YCN0_9FLAO|nr:T9SS C-terminal target domain-containing protein [Flavobacterium nackdongense]QBN18120.1 T9SS C-terminal target domain-containing protein [Flavobacterium nackdongense]
MKQFVFVFILIHTISYSQIQGCTDSLAKNYNSQATINDGSCLYDSIKIKPITTVQLSDSLVETSGLIAFDNLFWTHNDDTDTAIYGLNSNGKIQKKVHLENIKNNDWESISQDNSYLYIGDFGNNSRGNRTDLHILRIEKKSFLAHKPVIDTLSFSYSNQIDFSPKKGNTTDFDCEAFVVTQDSIYLFTKQWTQNETSIYALPKSAGKHIAQLKETINVKGLVTDASLLSSRNAIVLCGYTRNGKPFLYLLYDYQNNHFSSGNKRRIDLGLPFHQIEAIATFDEKTFYITNESFIKKPIINNRQQWHSLDLSPFLTP